MSGRLQRPRRSCVRAYQNSPLRDLTNVKNVKKTPTNFKQKTEKLKNPPKRRKISIQTTDDDLDFGCVAEKTEKSESSSFSLSSEDSDYSPEKASRDQPFVKKRTSRISRIRLDSSSSEGSSGESETISVENVEDKFVISKSAQTQDRMTRSASKNTKKVATKQPVKRKSSAKKRDKVVEKEEAGKGKEGSSSDDEWLESEPIEPVEVPGDDKFNEIANLVKATENVSFRDECADENECQIEQLEAVEIKIKTKKSPKECKRLSYGQQIMMLLKREQNRNRKNSRQQVHKVHILTALNQGQQFLKLAMPTGLIYAQMYSICAGWTDGNVEDEFAKAFEVDIQNEQPFSFYELHESAVVEQISRRKITNQLILAVILKIVNTVVGRRVRIVHNLNIPAFKEPTSAQIQAREKREKATLKSWKCTYFANSWLELFDTSTDLWNLHPFYQESLTMNPLKRLAPNPSYIFGFCESYVKDVTARYDPNWLTTTRKLRVASYDREWWKQVQTNMEANLPKREKRLEDKALQKFLVSKPIPKTISAFKDHPLYALERHLLKFQAFYPDDIEPIKSETGEFKTVRNELIYPRSAVKTLHTPGTWLQEARQIRAGEKPYKWVASWYHNKKLGLEPDAKNLAIYGKWQTEEFVPPVIEDNGIIPRNRYGNVDLYKPQMCPINGRHISGRPGLVDAATELKLDAVHAVVGWEKGTAPIPKFDGWIVHEKTADQLLAHYESKKNEILDDIKKSEAARLKKAAERRKYECKYCGKMLTAVKNRKVHIQLKHPGKKAY